jgi:hypothetical protein
MSRQQTPDIMENLMNGSARNTAIKQESNKEIITENKIDDLEKDELLEEKQESNKTIKLSKNKAIIDNRNKELKDEMKEKATFNISLKTLESLEDAWIHLRRQIKGELRITKTAIVEIALEMAIEELMEKKSESKLYKRLAYSR